MRKQPGRFLLMLGAACVAVSGLHPPGMGGVGMAVADEMPSTPKPGHSEPLPGPRDPEIAVREEFDIAIASGTADALALFIRRHLGHPLADKAQRALNELVAPERPE